MDCMTEIDERFHNGNSPEENDRIIASMNNALRGHKNQEQEWVWPNVPEFHVLWVGEELTDSVMNFKAVRTEKGITINGTEIILPITDEQRRKIVQEWQAEEERNGRY